MKFIAIIPARYASSRFPGKPLAKIAGKTMIQCVYEKASAFFDTCYVATDDQRIYDAVKLFGGNVVMTGIHHNSGTDRCMEAYQIICKQTDSEFDVVVNIQGDEPFLSPKHLEAISEAFDDERTQIATLVKTFTENEDVFNPNSPKVVVSTDGFALYFSRSTIPFMRGKEKDQWQANYPFMKHIGLYAYRSDILRKITSLEQSPLELAESLEQLRWLENGLRIKVMRTEVETMAIDTPEDLEKALKFLSEQHNIL